jgi:nucleoside 2-deoxyribosyltransferase
VLRRAGYLVIDPWALASGRAIERVRGKSALRRANAVAARDNQRAIDRADALVAVLDGADVDSGTAAEIGYAFARSKRIVGYRGDSRRAGENEGAVVNLQVEYFIRASGGTIVTRVSDLPRALRRAAASSSRRTR